MNISVYLLSHCHFLRVRGEAEDGSNRKDADSPHMTYQGSEGSCFMHFLQAGGCQPVT